ncbi:MAG: hypothetical protein ACREKL_03380, partial [Chthoniobacterales bacterium]
MKAWHPIPVAATSAAFKIGTIPGCTAPRFDFFHDQPVPGGILIFPGRVPLDVDADFAHAWD